MLRPQSNIFFSPRCFDVSDIDVSGWMEAVRAASLSLWVFVKWAVGAISVPLSGRLRLLWPAACVSLCRDCPSLHCGTWLFSSTRLGHLSDQVAMFFLVIFLGVLSLILVSLCKGTLLPFGLWRNDQYIVLSQYLIAFNSHIYIVSFTDCIKNQIYACTCLLSQGLFIIFSILTYWFKRKANDSGNILNNS